jgi:hypothetical protein
MRDSPETQWRSLTQLYGEMGEIELRELAAQMDDLTEMAQSVLRDELRKRGLDRPLASTKAIRFGLAQPDTAGNQPDIAAPGEWEAEFTWKTPLCDCEDGEHAWQIAEVLRRAGIESWIEGPRSYSHWDLWSPRITVAADQLAEARELISKPIPQDIVELSRTPDPVYRLPVCPGCGAAEPALEGNEPANCWRCESCGKEWSESAELEE